MIVTTTNGLEGYRIVRHIGVVRGLTVRSRSVVGNIGAAIQILFGGNISVYTKLAEQTRQEAFDLMITHAGGSRRECRPRHALRRQRDRLRRHGGAGLRHGRGCGKSRLIRAR